MGEFFHTLYHGVNEKCHYHISTQRMLQQSNHHITAALTVSLEGTQDGNRVPAITPSGTAAANPLPPALKVHPEGIQDEKA